MSRTILVVAAQAQTRSALARTFRGGGYRVMTAGNALGAMLICACDAIDLVIAAPELPGINGAQLGSTLSRALPAVPVVLLSGQEQPDALLERARAALAAAPSRRPAAVAAPGRPAHKTA
jgi:DNA-binding NtrC family response regulator